MRSIIVAASARGNRRPGRCRRREAYRRPVARVDPRVVAVEESYLGLVASMHSPLLRQIPADDALVILSEIDHPLCNGVVSPRLDPARAAGRVDELLELLDGHGRLYQWWIGPLSASSAVEGRLLERGLERSEEPGMHLDLARVDLAPAPTDAEITSITAGATTERTTATELIGEAFGVAPALVPLFEDVLFSVDGVRLEVVLARVEGRPVGTGAVAIDGRVAGLYNIAVTEGARNGGIGRALTLHLLALARAHGCTDAVLHASELGLPVYERIGFETVTVVRSYTRPSGEAERAAAGGASHG